MDCMLEKGKPKADCTDAFRPLKGLGMGWFVCVCWGIGRGICFSLKNIFDFKGILGEFLLIPHKCLCYDR